MSKKLSLTDKLKELNTFAAIPVNKLPEKYIEGNVRERSVIDIWNDPNSFAYNRKFNLNQLGPLCKNCKYGEKCKGGCTVRSVSITGKPHNDPKCFYRTEKELYKDKSI